MIRVTTKAQLAAALKQDPNASIEIDAKAAITIAVSAGAPVFRLLGKTVFYVEAWGSSQLHVVAWGSSQPHVEARESSQPHVVARESSQPHVVAWGSSQPHVVAWGSSQPHVVAWESSQPHVVAWGSSQPHVEARGSSQPHVVAWESSQPHVVAWESSQPHVEARESSQPHVVAWESSQPHVEAKAYAQLSLFGRGIKASATANVSILLHAGATVSGGQAIVIHRETAAEWCDYYGIDVTDGTATLYKALNADFKSQHGMYYAPGTIPIAPDWDGGKIECGGGLHFSPTPAMALEFHPEATRFAGCPVALADIAVHPNGQYPQKVKARGCCGPCFEVDRSGNAINAEIAA